MSLAEREIRLSEAAKLLDEVSGVVIGKEECKELLLVALLCGGHMLIEGPPGTAKTLLAKTFAMAVGGKFKRVQCTPDMLPADVTGFYLYRPEGDARFIPGPVFANILMADELNRTTPRAQSAFLEAMQEHQVTLEGVVHPLPQPFMLIASQIPSGGEGTYPLPETQVDRFMFRAWSAYPNAAEEAHMLARIDVIDEAQVQPILSLEEVLALQQRVKEIYLTTEVREYIVALVERLRRNPDLLQGPSARAGISLYKGSRALALMTGRDFVLPDDVKHLALPALEHRLRIRPEAETDGVTPSSLVSAVLEEVPVPK